MSRSVFASSFSPLPALSWFIAPTQRRIGGVERRARRPTAGERPRDAIEKKEEVDTRLGCAPSAARAGSSPRSNRLTSYARSTSRGRDRSSKTTRRRPRTSPRASTIEGGSGGGPDLRRAGFPRTRTRVAPPRKDRGDEVRHRRALAASCPGRQDDEILEVLPGSLAATWRHRWDPPSGGSDEPDHRRPSRPAPAPRSGSRAGCQKFHNGRPSPARSTFRAT